MTDICSACEQGVLDLRRADRTLRYDGVTLTVANAEYAHCPVCGEDMVLPAQAKHNDLLYADARRAHDGLLLGHEIYAVREKLGISQQEAAALFGGGPNSFSKYERGEVSQSRAMDVLIRMAAELPEVVAYLSRHTGISVEENWVDAKDAFGVGDVVVSIEKLNAVRAKRADRNVAAYLIRQEPNCPEANDGVWRDEPEMTRAAYGR
jgi:HTH-type transcriptional regulator/antitoxin MqsA